VQPEQPDTPADETSLPIAQPVRSASPRPRPDRNAEVARLRRVTRAVLIAIAVALTGVFVAAFRIHPYDEDGKPRTMSTHTQLGMPPCNFVVMTGKPCPSCGMTTSFALLVRGDLVASARANWVGSVICVLWALMLVWALASGLRGKALFVPPGRGELVFTVIVGVVLLLMLARWAAILLGG
jgi:hypothetical protein